MQKGSAALLTLLLVVILVTLVGVWYVKVYHQQGDVSYKSVLPGVINSSPKAKQTNIFKSDLGFQFEVPEGLSAKVDSEEDYSKRNGGDARKNFTGYVQYEPAKFLGAVGVVGAKNDLNVAPFAIWVLDNSNNLSAEQFFNKYWYYPFLWGQFNPPEKMPLAPKFEATVSGQIVKYGVVDYQNAKYYYLSSGIKMLLIRVLTNNPAGDQILATFKLQ